MFKFSGGLQMPLTKTDDSHTRSAFHGMTYYAAIAFIQTEVERGRREAAVQQSIESGLNMHVCKLVL